MNMSNGGEHPQRPARKHRVARTQLTEDKLQSSSEYLKVSQTHKQKGISPMLGGLVPYSSPQAQPLTTIIAGTCTLIFCLSLVVPGDGVVNLFGLSWMNTLMGKFYVWNLVTGSFVETNLLKAAVGAAGIGLLGPTTEESLGQVGGLMYILIVAAASGVVSSCSLFTIYVITRYEHILSIAIYGSLGLVMAMAVACVQSHQHSTPLRHLPVLAATISGALHVAGLSAISHDFPFVCVGPYAGWVYLRFFHRYDSGRVGDTSEAFQLVKFFPAQLAPVLQPLSDFASPPHERTFITPNASPKCHERYGVCHLLGVLRGREDYSLPTTVQTGGLAAAPPLLAAGTLDSSGFSDRRRALALKLLDAKFKNMESESSSAGPARGSGERESSPRGDSAPSSLLATQADISPVARRKSPKR